MSNAMSKWPNGDPVDWLNRGTFVSGGAGTFGVRISVAAICDDLNGVVECDDVDRALYRAERIVRDALEKELYRKDPNTAIRIADERTAILGLFADTRVFVEELPNGYAKDHPWFSLFPWFKITTPIGHFVIGARKRVISIDWTDTIVEARAVELFPDENVTREGRMIHAWSIEDAGRYVRKVLEAGGVPVIGQAHADPRFLSLDCTGQGAVFEVHSDDSSEPSLVRFDGTAGELIVALSGCKMSADSPTQSAPKIDPSVWRWLRPALTVRVLPRPEV